MDEIDELIKKIEEYLGPNWREYHPETCGLEGEELLIALQNIVDEL